MAIYKFVGMVNPDYMKVIIGHPAEEIKMVECKDLTCAKKFAIYMLDMEKFGVKEFIKVEIYNTARNKWMGTVWSASLFNRKGYTWEHDMDKRHGVDSYLIGKNGLALKSRKKKSNGNGPLAELDKAFAESKKSLRI